MLSVIVLSTFLLKSVVGECVVESHRCDFPFQRDGETYYSCQEGDENSDRFYCVTQLEDKYVMGLCNGGCFEADGTPSMFNTSMGEDVMSFFCKTSRSPCKFPFTWEGNEYRECTMDGDTPYPWCALEVDGAGNLVDNRWGRCDMSTCDPVSEPSAVMVPEAKSLSFSFPEYTGSLTLSQEGPDDQLNVSGDVSDLPEGRLLLAVVQGGCDAPFEDVQDSLVELGPLEAGQSFVGESLSLSLYPGAQSILGRAAIIKEEDPPLIDENGVIEHGKILSCVLITEPTSLPLYIIIIIIVAAVLLLIIIIACLVCCCCCRNKRKRTPVADDDSIDEDPMGNGRAKTPLFDELSIPFIDASLPPTPKMGRSTDQLAILLGRGSKTSLTNYEKA